MIKEILKKINSDITADMARENYKKYQSYLKKEQKYYIKSLRNNIKATSKQGKKHVDTISTSYDFMTDEFIYELKEYFEQRGFCVEKLKYSSPTQSFYFRISW